LNSSCFERIELLVSILEAFAAVYRTVIVGLERNLALLTASSTYSIEHLTCAATLTTACLTGSTAVTASLRLVGKALLCVKFLLAGRKLEFPSAILADQCLVCVHD
jgi:hypothetical protein